MHRPEQHRTPRLRQWAVLYTVAVLALLAGCASGPQGGAIAYPPGRDGPEAHPPADLDQVPDAVPKVELIRPGGPNKPYEVLGKRYVPLTGDEPFTERGLASWYGKKFQGHPTASGELYNMYAMTAAHPTLPIPSYVRVRNPANGREVIVRVNDRGPFHSKRIIDLSYTAALKLGLLKGVAPVEIERITYDEIRAGTWRHGDGEGGATMLARADAAPAPAAAASATAAATPSPALEAASASEPPPAAAVRPLSAPAPALSPTPSASIPAALPASDPILDAATAAASATPLPPVAAPSAEAPIETASQPARAYTRAAQGFWVQIGAFRDAGGAVDFERRVQAELDWLAPLLAIFNDHHLHRLQAGPYQTRADALSAAQRIRSALQLVPVIVERR